MYAVSGASGQLGRRTVELLRERVDASRIVALSRTPEKLADLAVTARQADFNDPDGLVSALAGVERLLIISTDDLREPGFRATQHAAAIQAAAKAGVGHLLYTSFTRTEPGNPAFVSPDHHGTEQALAESGLPYTSLRNNVYTELLLATAPPAVAGGVLAANNGDGATAYVTREDIAALAAALLAEGGHENSLLEVSGPAAVTQAEVAQALAEVTGKPVRYQPLTDEEAVAGMVQAGMPEGIAQAYASFGTAAREGFLDHTSDVITRITGQAPTSVADFLAAHRTLLS
jgi:NAD(P)H dehydrogenase (quinone)